MKIDAFGNIKENNPIKKRQAVSSGGIFSNFLSVAETDESAHTSKPSNVIATTDVSHLLALQEVSEEEVRRKKLIKRGDEMLNTLEQLRRKLLLGTLPMNMLQDISAQLATHKETIADPALLAIIADIELRTAVELAKLEMAVASRSIID